MEKEIHVKRVAMHKISEVENSSLVEARIKIEKLEKELALSKIQIVHFEKENYDLTTVIVKLYDKFLNKPLDSLIDNLESNLSLLDETVRNIEKDDSNDHGASLSSECGITVDDQPSENDPNPKMDLLIGVTESSNGIRNDNLISLSSDDENTVDDQDESIKNGANIQSDSISKVAESSNHIRNHNSICLSSDDENTVDDRDKTIKNGVNISTTDLIPKVTQSLNRVRNNDDLISLSSDNEITVDNQEESMENEANINTADLFAKFKESLNRMNNFCDSIANVDNNRTMNDDSRRNDEEILMLSDEDGSNQSGFQRVSHPIATTIIDLGDSSSQSSIDVCLLLSDDSNSVTCLKTGQQQTEANMKDDYNSNKDTCCLETHQQNPENYSDVLQKPTLAESDNLLPLVPNENDLLRGDYSIKATYSEIKQETNSFSGVSRKPTLAELDNLSISARDEDDLLGSDYSNEVDHSKTKQEKNSCSGVLQKPTFDDSSTRSANSNNATCLKIKEEVNSFSGILQKLTPVKFDDSSTQIGTEGNLPQDDDSNDTTCSKIKENINSSGVSRKLNLVEFDDSLIQIGAEINLLQGDDFDDATSSTNQESTSSDDVSQKQTIVRIVQHCDSSSSPESYEKVGRDEFEFVGDSSTQSNSEDYSLQNMNDSNSASNSKNNQETNNFLGFLKRKTLELERVMNPETNARKRSKTSKLDLYGSYCSPSSLLLSPNSTNSSLEEIRRRNRLPTWPCPICDECFTNSLNYSKHLNQKHVGDERVCTCSICGFITATIPAHKRHVNKYHSRAFLLENSFQFIENNFTPSFQVMDHLAKEHAYAKWDFDS